MGSCAGLSILGGRLLCATALFNVAGAPSQRIDAAVAAGGILLGVVTNPSFEGPATGGRIANGSGIGDVPFGWTWRGSRGEGQHRTSVSASDGLHSYSMRADATASDEWELFQFLDLQYAENRTYRLHADAMIQAMGPSVNAQPGLGKLQLLREPHAGAYKIDCRCGRQAACCVCCGSSAHLRVDDKPGRCCAQVGSSRAV